MIKKDFAGIFSNERVMSGVWLMTFKHLIAHSLLLPVVMYETKLFSDVQVLFLHLLCDMAALDDCQGMHYT